MYSYTGTPYTEIFDDPDVPGTYTTDMRLTGSFILPAPLPANSSGNTQVLTFNFSDGRISAEQGDLLYYFDPIITDANGNIVEWQIQIASELQPIPYDFQWASSNFLCANTFCGDAVFFSPDPSGSGPFDGARSFVPGTWTATPIPEPSAYLLMLTGFGLVVAYAARGSTPRGRWST
jgi:hypothetical protein